VLSANVITRPIISIVERTFLFTMPCHLMASPSWRIFWISDMVVWVMRFGLKFIYTSSPSLSY